MFAKLLLTILLILLVFAIGIRTLARALRGALRNPGEPSPSRVRSGGEKKAENMLACSVCGVHAPESEGIKEAGKFFCCEAHRK